jgi:hypothetical protein
MESDESQVQLELQRIAEIKDSLERFIPELSTLYSADVIRWTFAMCTGFCLRQAVDENPDWRAPAQAHVERLRAVVNGKLNMSPKRDAVHHVADSAVLAKCLGATLDKVNEWCRAVGARRVVQALGQILTHTILPVSISSTGNSEEAQRLVQLVSDLVLGSGTVVSARRARDVH